MRVVIHYNETGDMSVHADDGVEVLVVCDFTPADRIYRMSHSPIPSGLIEGPIGHAGDGSSAEKKATLYARLSLGERPFDVIDGGQE